MKRAGTIILGLLLVCLLGLLVYDLYGIRDREIKMPPSNLTLVSAPEQSEPMEHEAFQKAEYVPELPEGENLAPEGKIKASSFADVYVPRKVLDGNVDGPSYWEAEPDSYPNILTLSLEKPALIHGIRVRLNPKNIWGKRTQEFGVRISEDGESFQELFAVQTYDFDPDRGNEVILNFEPRSAVSVELEFRSNTGAAGAQVAELEVYGSYE